MCRQLREINRLQIRRQRALSLRVEKVLYFAACRERAGVPEEELALAGLTVAAAKARLVERHAALATLLPHCRVAVNEQFAADEDAVPAGAVLALIPPVAGG